MTATRLIQKRSKSATNQEKEVNERDSYEADPDKIYECDSCEADPEKVYERAAATRLIQIKRSMSATATRLIQKHGLFSHEK